MLRFLGFLLQISALVALSVWLAGTPGRISLEAGPYLIETSLTVGIVALGLLVLLVLLLSALWRFFRHGPEGFRLRRRIRQLEEQQSLIEQGFSAIAGGDTKEAKKLMERAQRKMPDQPLSLLMRAQAARLLEDHSAANRYYAALADERATANLGWRGLISEAARQGQSEEAARLSRQAASLLPDSSWLCLYRLEQEARAGDWTEALGALRTAIKLKAQPAATLAIKEAALLLAMAKDALTREALEGAQSKAERALKIKGPHRSTAAALLAEVKLHAGDTRGAAQQIMQAWKEEPDAALFAVWQKIHAGLPALEFFRLTEKLVAKHPDHNASRLALAQAAVAADLWGEARRFATPLVSEKQKSALRLLAEIEAREFKASDKVSEYLQAAADAPEDTPWQCNQCRARTTDWQPICRQCGALGSYAQAAASWALLK